MQPTNTPPTVLETAVEPEPAKVTTAALAAWTRADNPTVQLDLDARALTVHTVAAKPLTGWSLVDGPAEVVDGVLQLAQKLTFPLTGADGTGIHPVDPMVAESLPRMLSQSDTLAGVIAGGDAMTNNAYLLVQRGKKDPFHVLLGTAGPAAAAAA